MLECDPQLVVLVIIAFLVAFVLAFGIGANDVANSFGTSVGSKVLTTTQACVLATIFEILGAVLIGYKVSDTMRKGILDNEMYDGDEKLLMLGALSSLIASAIWLLFATAMKLPISGTHSIVGATVGYSLVLKGLRGIHWMSLLRIAASWFISPLVSGVVSFLLYYVIKKCILNSKNPMKSGLRALPVVYGITFAINILSVLFDGSKLLGLDGLPLWVILVSALGIGTLTGIVVLLVIVPYQRKQLLKDSTIQRPKTEKSVATIIPTVIVQDESNLNHVNKTVTVSSSTIESGIAMSKNDSFATLEQAEAGDREERRCENENSKEKSQKCEIEGQDKDVKEHPAVAKLFSFLQILTATFGSFAHGGNDVSNAIGPLIAVWTIFEEGSVKQNSETPILILLYGGIGISVGLWCLGHRVIKTVGNDLVEITPTSGFSIEIASAATVLLASKAGLPISTTHCKVGSVICVGWASNGKNQVSWNTFRNIAFAWLFTVPASCAISAFCVWALQPIFI